MQAPTRRALRQLALLAGATLAAASIWAAGDPQQPFMIDADTWQQEVMASTTGEWAKDGWYRLDAYERSVEVRRVNPGDSGTVAADALFLRLPQGRLVTGQRPGWRYLTALAQPRLGEEHELTLGAMRFSVRVEESAKGMAYTIAYGGKSYGYVLGPFDATTTAVRFVADLDGDGKPDFLVDVDGATYLLLSSRAHPGANLPTAELFGGGY